MTEPRTIVDPSGRSHRFPPPLELDYSIVEGAIGEGKVKTRSLEAHVVDHCNLTCAECCSLSPLLPPRFTTPEALARDLALASRVLAPAVFKLVGGEPLLHPELPELLRVARGSGIAPRVSLTTNGLRLGTMPDACWEQLDGLTVSRYPSPVLGPELVAEVEHKAARFGVRLNWKQQDHFVTMSLPRRRDDEAETARIYARCWLRERCHLVHEGRLYTCTRPVHVQSARGLPPERSGDGLELSARAPEAVLDYLRRPQPLDACAHCAGGDAPMAPHHLLRGDELRRLRRPSLPGPSDAAGSPPAPA